MPEKLKKALSIAMLCAAGAIGFHTASAQAQVTITDTIGSSGSFLISGSPIKTTTHSNVKITFVDKTTGTNVALCAGSAAQISSNTCGIQLSDSGGPSDIFLTIIDIADLNGLVLYALRESGTANAEFTLTIE